MASADAWRVVRWVFLSVTRSLKSNDLTSDWASIN